jgi:predicted Zn-dependent peptidase
VNSKPGAPSAHVVRLQCGGVPTLLSHNPAHEVVALRLYVRGGSSSLDSRHAGADALHARVARRGTRHYPKEKLNADLARMGTEIGGDAGEDWTSYRLRCVRRHFEASWQILADVVLHPLLADLGRELTYEGHPYAAHPGGTEESVRDLSVELLRTHAESQLTRGNLLLVVAGDVTREALEPLVESTLGQLPDGNGEALLPPPLRFAGSRLQVEARELPTNYILGQFPAPALDVDTYAATLLAMSVLRDRLFEEVRTKRNLSYAPAAGLGSQGANVGWIYVTAIDTRQTMRVMLDEMKRMREVPLDAKELRDKVQVYITRYYLQNETNQAQVGFLGRESGQESPSVVPSAPPLGALSTRRRRRHDRRAVRGWWAARHAREIRWRRGPRTAPPWRARGFSGRAHNVDIDLHVLLVDAAAWAELDPIADLVAQPGEGLLFGLAAAPAMRQLHGGCHPRAVRFAPQPSPVASHRASLSGCRAESKTPDRANQSLPASRTPAIPWELSDAGRLPDFTFTEGRCPLIAHSAANGAPNRLAHVYRCNCFYYA